MNSPPGYSVCADLAAYSRNEYAETGRISRESNIKPQ